MDPKELKVLAEKFGLKQLEACIQQQLDKGANACDIVDETDTVITELSKASVIRELMDQGLSFSDALRELGRRIRSIYHAESEKK